MMSILYILIVLWLKLYKSHEDLAVVLRVVFLKMSDKVQKWRARWTVRVHFNKNLCRFLVVLFYKTETHGEKWYKFTVLFNNLSELDAVQELGLQNPKFMLKSYDH
jgi:hypothetical protein